MVSNFSRAQGFTLVEVATVVVIVAIFAAIAFPSYRSSMQKSRRAEGKVLLQTVMAAEERFYSSANRYASQAGPAGLGVSTESVPGQYYVLSNIAVSDDGQTATLTVTPQHVQAGDPCGNLTLDSTGRRGSTAEKSVASSCW